MGVQVELSSFLIKALDGDEWLASCPDHCTPRQGTPSHSLYQLNNSLGGPRANVDALEKRQMSFTCRKWTAVP